MTAALLSKNKERQRIEMKKKLLVKASALACSLALVFSCATFTSLAQKDYTVKEKVTISNPESVDVATLYNVSDNKSLSDLSDLKNPQSFSSNANSVVKKSSGNFQGTLGVLTQINDIDLTKISVDEWSYTVSAEIPASAKQSHFGWLDSWTKVGSTVNNEGGVYTVTDGDTEYGIVATCITEDSGYYRMIFTSTLSSLVGRKVGGKITVAENNAELTEGLPNSSNIGFGDPYNVYWNSNPAVKVEYKNNNDGTHTYTVTALNVFTKNDDNSFTAIDGGKILKQTVVADDSEANTGYVLLGAGHSYGDTTAVTLSDFSVSYTQVTDFTTACEAFVNANPVITELDENTFKVTADTAYAKKTELNSLLSAYNALDPKVKSVIDKNYADLESKINAAIKLCENAIAIYGKFTTPETVTVDNATSVDVATLYNVKNGALSTDSYFTGGSNITYTANGNYNGTLGVLTKVNDVDLTKVDVNEWSYKISATDVSESAFGYLHTWSKIGSTVEKTEDGYSVINGDTSYDCLASNFKKQDDGYYRLIAFGSTNFAGRYTGGEISVADGEPTLTKSVLNNVSFNNDFKIYWKDIPAVKVEYKDNKDGTHLYTVTALDVYTLNEETKEYESAGNVVLNSLTVTDGSEQDTNYVLIGGGKDSGRSDKLVYSDFSVSYTVDKDITEDCIVVLSAGNGIYEKFGDTLGDLVITNSNLAEVNANLAALEASYNGADETVKTAIDAKDFSTKLAYYKNYADAVAKTAHAELLGVQLKNESSVEASDLRFVVKYEANTASGYTVSSYGAVVVPNQVRGNNPDLTRKIDVVSGKEDYFVDVNVESDTVTVDGNNRFYVNVTNSKGKPGLLFDCRPYVVYTNGTDEFTVYADNAVADTDVTEGQATKCALFAAKKLSESITSKLGTDVTYPDGFDSTSYPAIIEKINKLEAGDTSLGKTTAEEKKAVFAFVAMNYDAYKA